jgi:hypothetical protein
MTREALQQIEKQQYLADGTIFSEDYKLQTIFFCKLSFPGRRPFLIVAPVMNGV